MPSLKQLEKFQHLMGNIGKENQLLAEAGLPPEKLRLPDAEPAPPLPKPEEELSAWDSAAQSVTKTPDTAPPPETPADEVVEPQAVDSAEAVPLSEPRSEPESAPEPELDTNAEVSGFDFSDFGDFVDANPPDNAAVEQPPPDNIDIPDEINLDESPPVPDSADGADDFAGLNLDDFGAAEDAPAEEDALNLDNFGAAEDTPPSEDFNLDDFGAAEDTPPSEDFNLDDFGAAEDTPAEEDALNLDNLIPDESAEPAEEPAGEGGDFNFDDLNLEGGADFTPAEEEDIPSVTDVSDEEKSALLSGRKDESAAGTESKENPAEDNEASDENVVDRFDTFNFDNNKDSGNEMPGLDDFNLTDTAEAKTPGQPEEKVKAVSFTEKQLADMLETLSTYPLNVRIACEEVIVEQVIPPAQFNALTELLLSGGSASEAARLVSKILGKKVAVPKSHKTGEELEEDQKSFLYIFIHKFFPVIRMFIFIALLAASVSYLAWNFIINPIRAERLYQKGYELIELGDPNEYRRANQYFSAAFEKHRVKDWFYKYARRFRDEKQYLYAREKYDELLYYYPHDKQGVLEYADMEAGDLRNFEKADRLIRTEILDYSIDDKEGLLALGDTNLAWAEIDYSRYEEAREAYARLLSVYGYTDPVLERMLLYFIRTDKLFEVLPLQQRFMNNPKSKITAPSLAELGGYLLDKRLEVPDSIPDENIERIEGIKDVLLRAEKIDSTLPEPHYHLARYYNFYGTPLEERYTLEAAAAAFDAARRENVKRTGYRIDTQRRLAKLMTNSREFLQAEDALVKGVNIYEDALTRGLLTRKPEFGRLYADLGDLEYFVKEGALKSAERYYQQAEAHGWLPPEIQYRLGNTQYRQANYPDALQRFFNVSREIPPFNRKLLFALANTSYQNADYFAAQGYYRMLLDILETERMRILDPLPDASPEHQHLLERLMTAQNNMGVTLNALAMRTGGAEYRTEALALLAEAIRGWDLLSRDQNTMIRSTLLDPRLPGVSRPYLNMQHALYPTPGTEPQLFMNIDDDVLEPSDWGSLLGR